MPHSKILLPFGASVVLTGACAGGPSVMASSGVSGAGAAPTSSSASAPPIIDESPPFQVVPYNGCLLDVDGGALACWGDNSYGQMGNGEADMTPRLSPVLAAQGYQFRWVAVGTGHVCGLDETGIAFCWGLNDEHECGPGCGATPKAMYSSHHFTSLSAGRTNTCGLEEAGSGYCWGSNANLALGVADTSVTFTQVPGGPFVTILTDQDLTCALDHAGAVTCWGLPPAPNVPSGDCGCNDPENDCAPCTTPVGPMVVSDGHVFKTLSVQPFNVCGVDAAGVGWCWGDNGAGQLTTGDTMPQSTPVPFHVPDGAPLREIVGMSPICALTTDGQVYCAGQNDVGELGQGTADQASHTAAVRVALPPIAHLVGGNEVMCALTETGERYCWGSNSSGTLGDGTTQDRWSPELIP